MDEKLKIEMMLIFNQGFEELVLPAVRELREETRQGFKQVSVEFKLVRNEIGNVKKELKGDFTDLKQEMNQGFEEVNDKLDSLEKRDNRLADEQVDFRARLRRVENAVFKKAD